MTFTVTPTAVPAEVSRDRARPWSRSHVPPRGRASRSRRAASRASRTDTRSVRRAGVTAPSRVRAGARNSSGRSILPWTYSGSYSTPSRAANWPGRVYGALLGLCGRVMTFGKAPPAGRFAPTTSGPAHPGTLLAGLLAWLDARSRGARFTLRLEDIDPDRCRPEHAAELEAALAWLGLDWDERSLQSERRAEHEAALDRLRALGATVVHDALLLLTEGARATLLPSLLQLSLLTGLLDLAIVPPASLLIDRLQRWQLDLEETLGRPPPPRRSGRPTRR